MALLPDFLSQEDRASGRLVAASDQPPLCLGQYALVWPADTSMPPALIRFRDWLAEVRTRESTELATGGNTNGMLASPTAQSL